MADLGLIPVENRVVAHPNRYKLELVNAEENIYDLVAMPGAVAAEGTVVDKEFLGKIQIPWGAIVMWAGVIDDIPSGWVLCDGTNGTPDLRGRFIIGAGGSYNVGTTGGEEKHTLTTTEMPSHSHSMTFRAMHSDVNDSYIGLVKGRNANSSGYATSSVGGNAAHENRPPYYALCYIMHVAA